MTTSVPIAGTGPGAGLRELVDLMDRLRSPGGCPWDAEQTHASLVPYVLEEAYEVAEAIEAGDRAGLREELGDLLLQVVFHARIAREDAGDPFDVDDVARAVAAKLVRRHPHVFADPSSTESFEGHVSVEPPGSGQGQEADENPHARWDRIKKAEKQRTSVLEGIPLAQGALARAQKVLARAGRAGLAIDVADVARRHAEGPSSPPGRRGVAETEAELGARLLVLAAQADEVGVDAEVALRAALRTLEATIRSAETR